MQPTLTGVEGAAGKAEKMKLKSVKERQAADKSAAITFVAVKDAEVGKQYLNWTLQQVVVLSGQLNERAQVLEYQVTVNTRDGELMELWLPTHYPLRDDERLVGVILEQYEKAIKRQTSMVKTTTKEVIDAETGEVKVVRVAKVSHPRGEVDPRTGYGRGTDAHAFGTIMLDLGTGPDQKEACCQAIFVILKERGKPYGYAKAWYSYLKKKKPEIYGT